MARSALPGSAPRLRLLAALAIAGVVSACVDGPDRGVEGGSATVDSSGVTLGPVDGRALPGEALDRVAVGDAAPDFTLASYAGGPVRLSDFRSRKLVLLVFYRGHW